MPAIRVIVADDDPASNMPGLDSARGHQRNIQNASNRLAIAMVVSSMSPAQPSDRLHPRSRKRQPDGVGFRPVARRFAFEAREPLRRVARYGVRGWRIEGPV